MQTATIRDALFQLCSEFIAMRINTATTAIKQSREAANDDTKSSAGDKFETTREMMQQDIERSKRLLMDAEDNQRILEALKDVPISSTARNGSLVFTDQGNFFLSISAGQLKLGQLTVFAISAVSPIGKLLLGKEIGDSFNFNGKEYKVIKVG